MEMRPGSPNAEVVVEFTDDEIKICQSAMWHVMRYGLVRGCQLTSDLADADDLLKINLNIYSGKKSMYATFSQCRMLEKTLVSYYFDGQPRGTRSDYPEKAKELAEAIKIETDFREISVTLDDDIGDLYQG